MSQTYADEVCGLRSNNGVRETT